MIVANRPKGLFLGGTGAILYYTILLQAIGRTSTSGTRSAIGEECHTHACVACGRREPYNIAAHIISNNIIIKKKKKKIEEKKTGERTGELKIK